METLALNITLRCQHLWCSYLHQLWSTSISRSSSKMSDLDLFLKVTGPPSVCPPGQKTLCCLYLCNPSTDSYAVHTQDAMPDAHELIRCGVRLMLMLTGGSTLHKKPCVVSISVTPRPISMPFTHKMLCLMPAS